MTEKLPSYGGQAVIEGVMMRGTRAMAVAVRDPKGEIQLHTRPLGSLYRGRLSKLPFLRGLLGLWDALGLGMQSLTWSAYVAQGEELEAAKASSQSQAPPTSPAGAKKAFDTAMIGTVILSLALGIGLFFLAPAAAGAGIDYVVGR